MSVIDRYDPEAGTYIKKEHDVHVSHIHVQYVNSAGINVSMNISASEFLEQFDIVKK